MAKTLIYCDNEERLRGFKLGYFEGNPDAQLTQGVDERGYYLLIEDDVDKDNQTYQLHQHHLEHTDTGVEL